MIIVECTEVTKTYHQGQIDIHALQDVSFSIEKGEFLAIAGPSGSGKTTIARGVEKELHRRGFICQVLDGDNIRSGINNNLGFTLDDRLENIRSALPEKH